MGVPYVIHTFMVYANLFIIYATPTPHITFLSSYINFCHTALDDANGNEFENPEPKYAMYISCYIYFP